jgi:S-adenosylmethionine:tRNA ribosyltransferase-isomerase
VKVELFDFELPEERIALHPAEPRDSARMLVVKPGEPLGDLHVTDLLEILRPGDVLVINDTKVLPAELKGTRVRGDNRSSISFNLHKRVDAKTWRAFARPAKRLRILDRLELGDDGSLGATVAGKGGTGEVTLEFDQGGALLDEAIKAHGAMPLPPYIEAKRPVEERDRTDYQTVYASVDGAVAAPTAGLHFTEALLQKLSERGIGIERVTLHVGAGTFLPVRTENVLEHRMHAERGFISAETAARIRAIRAAGGRIVPVGTTALRVLESAAPRGEVEAFDGETDIFIIPGYRFKVADLLVTNFHLPRSTLLMLVSAFAGMGRIREAYAHAIASGYRFYSYGDACLLERA